MIIKILIFFVISSLAAISQVLPGGYNDNNEKVEEVENNSKSYASFAVKSINMKGNWEYETGLKFGIQQENGIFYGISIMTLVSRDVLFDYNGGVYNLKMDYYGLDFGINKDIVNWFNVGGRVSLYLANIDFSMKQFKPVNDLSQDLLMFNELAAVSSLKVYEPVWLGFETGWRTALMFQSREYMSNSDLSGFFGEINLKIYVF